MLTGSSKKDSKRRANRATTKAAPKASKRAAASAVRTRGKGTKATRAARPAPGGVKADGIHTRRAAAPAPGTVAAEPEGDLCEVIARLEADYEAEHERYALALEAMEDCHGGGVDHAALRDVAERLTLLSWRLSSLRALAPC